MTSVPMDALRRVQAAQVPTTDGSILVRVEMVPPVIAPDELVEVAKCGLPQAPIRKRIREGTLAAVLLGRSLYIRRSSLLALVELRPQVIGEAGPEVDDVIAAHSAMVGKARTKRSRR